MSEGGRRPGVGVLVPVALVICVLVAALVMFSSDAPGAPGAPGAGGGSASVSAPLAVVADGEVFVTLDELVAASDLVVEGTVVSIDRGRTITDPDDPTAGLVTSLALLDVDTVFVGGAAESVTVEQEWSLLDGTPIVVNGVAPNQVGDTGFWFLVQGDTDEFPYAALVNEQARMLLDAQGRLGVGVLAASADELRAALTEMGR